MDSLFAIHKLPPFDGFTVKYYPFIHDFPHFPFYCVLSYLLFVYLGPKLMKNRDPVHLPNVKKYWDLFLSVLSGFIFLNIAPHILAVYLKKGLHYGICMPGEVDLWSGFHLFCAYVFTILKIFELFDTVLLVLQKKPVLFLHWFHHSTVLLYTWYTTFTYVPVGWVFLIVNALIHTIMYYYYYRRACGAEIGWARHLTQLQISQMVVGVFMSATWAHYYLNNQCPEPFFQDIPIGRVFIAASLSMYAAYFALFVQFYINRWNRKEN